jgi:hypothetical protein
MAARAHWFEDENVETENPESNEQQSVENGDTINKNEANTP